MTDLFLIEHSINFTCTLESVYYYRFIIIREGSLLHSYAITAEHFEEEEKQEVVPIMQSPVTNCLRPALHLSDSKGQFQVSIEILGVRTDEVQKQPPWVFYEKDVLKNFAKLTGKHLCQIPFLIKPQPAILLKKRVWQRSFPMDFVNLLRTPFFQNTFRRLLLEIKQRRNYGPVSVKETFCEQLKTNP